MRSFLRVNKMAMKQTQTKLFDFSDIGLDFSAGSKNLFPDRFKKMLSLGYNVQAVSSVAVAGNQVTFTYGGAHGYVADRVLKVDSAALASINNGEFWIDSVTTNTVTLTIDGAPIAVASGFLTRIAPLGWQLVYEQAAVHLYKFKDLDESDLYCRFVFQTSPNRKNKVQPCIGRTADLITGVITDIYAYDQGKTNIEPSYGFCWAFSDASNSTHNNYTYSQGYSSYGKANVVGSAYHLVFGFSLYNSIYGQYVNAILPTATIKNDSVSLPVVIGTIGENNWTNGQDNSQDIGAAYCGNIRVNFSNESSASFLFAKAASKKTNYYTDDVEPYNTTSAKPIQIFEWATQQFIGYAHGVYECMYSSNSRPSVTAQIFPLFTADIDVESIILLHAMSNYSPQYAFLAIPVEPVKYD